MPTITSFYKSEFTGKEIDQRLKQGTYDDAVKSGFTGTKEEFDKIIWAFNQEEQDKLNNTQPKIDEALNTVSKSIVGAINELLENIDGGGPIGDYVTESEFNEFKENISDTYALKSEIPDVSLFITEEDLPKQYIVEEGAALQAGDEQHEFNIKSGGRVTINSTNEVVTYTPYPGEEGRKMLVLANNDSLTGTKTDGTGAPLAFMSKWDKIEIGNSTTSLNLNSLNGEITINDDKVVATTDQIPEAYDDTQLRNELQQTETGVATANSEIEKLKSGKQDILISGTNIKTINGESLLGSGNIEISEGTTNITWEDIQNKPSFATVATSGSYDDLTNLPSLTEYITESELTEKGYLTSSALDEYQTIQDDSLNTDAKNISGAINELNTLIDEAQTSSDNNLETESKQIVGAINEINSQLPVYIQVPQLTESYTIPDNDTIREYTYEIPIGEVPHDILLSSNAKWNNDFAPTISANKTYIVSVIKNFAVWGEF